MKFIYVEIISVSAALCFWPSHENPNKYVGQSPKTAR